MSLFIDGMPCSLCEKPIQVNDSREMFAPFVLNEADPLFIFSDRTFHKECFKKHPLAKIAIQRSNEVETNGQPENRISFISGTRIDTPEDYLPIGFLTDNPQSPLFEFNFTHFRKSEISNWDRLEEFVQILTSEIANGRLSGHGVNWLMKQFSEKLMS